MTADAFNLAEARLNKGFSQRDLAREIGVNRDAIRRLETGVGGVRPATAKKVADFFEVRVTDLMPLEREAA